MQGHAYVVAGVVELGAGTGLVGLVLAAAGVIVFVWLICFVE